MLLNISESSGITSRAYDVSLVYKESRIIVAFAENSAGKDHWKEQAMAG